MTKFPLEIKVTSGAPGVVAFARKVNDTFNVVWSTFPVTGPSMSIETANEFQLYATDDTVVNPLVKKEADIVTLGNAYKVSSSLDLSPDGLSIRKDMVTVRNMSGRPITLVLQSPIDVVPSPKSTYRNVWMTESPVQKNNSIDILPSDLIAVWFAPRHTSEDSIIPGRLENFIALKYTGTSPQKLEFVGKNTIGEFSEPNGIWMVV
ncbi:hypothetical protein CPB86DRAFT_802016 [Serendipita vermifera]|nr:hypothetical protein CPB86DRAFT_802016 [Serendipita vermifera]